MEGRVIREMAEALSPGKRENAPGVELLVKCRGGRFGPRKDTVVRRVSMD